MFWTDKALLTEMARLKKELEDVERSMEARLETYKLAMTQLEILSHQITRLENENKELRIQILEYQMRKR